MRRRCIPFLHTRALIAACRLCVFGLLFFGTVSCTVLIDSELQQCASDDDCTSRGKAFAGTECVRSYCEVVVPKCSKDEDCAEAEACVDKVCHDRWACVDNGPEAATDAVTVHVPIATIFGDPLPGVPVRVCRRVDPTCDSPVDEAMSDASGVLTLDLPAGFTGYLEIVMDPFFPLLYFFPSDLKPDATLPVASLSPSEVIFGLGQAVGATPDPERGHILLAVSSCYVGAPGIHLVAPRADASTIPYYVLDGVPSADLNKTTASGSGGFLNFPPGNATVALETDSGKEITTLSLTVRPNFITSVNFQPNGAQ